MIPGGFKIGRVYAHTTGAELRIVGAARTYHHGWTLVGEDEQGNLRPIGSDESHTENYTDVTDEARRRGITP